MRLREAKGEVRGRGASNCLTGLGRKVTARGVRRANRGGDLVTSTNEKKGRVVKANRAGTGRCKSISTVGRKVCKKVPLEERRTRRELVGKTDWLERSGLAPEKEALDGVLERVDNAPTIPSKDE